MGFFVKPLLKFFNEFLKFEIYYIYYIIKYGAHVSVDLLGKGRRAPIGIHYFGFLDCKSEMLL